jgi:hypothetical protein
MTDAQMLQAIVDRKRLEAQAETFRLDTAIRQAIKDGQPMPKNYWHLLVKLEKQIKLLENVIQTF